MAEQYDRFEDIKTTLAAYAEFAAGEWQWTDSEKAFVKEIEAMLGATLLEVMTERLYERIKDE